ncbi:MAG TPA: hypothetical protein VGC18_10950 [Lacisediminihabitans sp.]
MENQKLLVEFMSLLLDWKTRPAFTAVSQIQSDAGVSEFDVEIDPRAERWYSRHRNSDAWARCDGALSAQFSNTGELPPGSPPALSVRLGFPTSLPIWGRRNDYFRPVGAEEANGEGVMLLRHPIDLSIFGSVTLDLDRGIAVRLTSPVHVWRLEDIRDVDHAKSQFGPSNRSSVK